MPYFILYTLLFSFMAYDMYKIKPRHVKGTESHIVGNSDYRIFILLTITLFLFAGLRGNGNGDYFNYINGVKHINSWKLLFFPGDYPFEFGFRFLSYITNCLKIRPQFVILSMNAISFSMLFYVVKKRSPFPLLSLVLFFPIMLIFDMHHSRSAIAISSGLVVFDFIYDKKFFNAFIFICIGVAFHMTALVTVVLLAVPFVTEKIDSYLYRNSLKKFIVIVVFFLVTIALINPLDLIVSVLDNNLTQYLFLKLKSYLSNNRWSYRFSLVDPRFIQSLIVMFYALLNFENVNKYVKNLIVIQVISVLVIILFRDSTILVIRLHNFFNIFSVILLPNLVDAAKNNSSSEIFRKFYTSGDLNKIILVLIVISYYIYTTSLIMKQVPYRFFFYR